MDDPGNRDLVCAERQPPRSTPLTAATTEPRDDARIVVEDLQAQKLRLEIRELLRIT
jgi:hypothetical protein